MNIARGIPGFIVWLFWFLLAIVLLVLAALLIHHLGGFGLNFHVGNFFFDLGVRG